MDYVPKARTLLGRGVCSVTRHTPSRIIAAIRRAPYAASGRVTLVHIVDLTTNYFTLVIEDGSVDWLLLNSVIEVPLGAANTQGITFQMLSLPFTLPHHELLLAPGLDQV